MRNAHYSTSMHDEIVLPAPGWLWPGAPTTPTYSTNKACCIADATFRAWPTLSSSSLYPKTKGKKQHAKVYIRLMRRIGRDKAYGFKLIPLCSFHYPPTFTPAFTPAVCLCLCPRLFLPPATSRSSERRFQSIAKGQDVCARECGGRDSRHCAY